MKSSTRRLNRQNNKTYKKQKENVVIAEVVLKLFFSLVIVTGSIISLAKLLAYQKSQLAKLQELQTQVKQTQQRVNVLRKKVHRNFDPQQTKSLMEEYSPTIRKDRQRVFWESQSKESQ